jgi:hypothetical protein
LQLNADPLGSRVQVVQGTDSLFVLAEIAIGLAGFTGVSAALYARDTWHPYDRYRTVALLFTSFGALGFALIPYGLQLLGVPNETLWRVCSGAIVAYVFVMAAVAFRTRPTEPSSLPFYGEITAVFSVVGGLGTLVQALNALGLFSASFGVYYLGLVVLLLVGGMQFAVIVLFRPS